MSEPNHRKELLKKILIDVHEIPGMGVDWLKAVWEEIGSKVGYDVTIKEIQDCIMEVGVESGAIEMPPPLNCTLLGTNKRGHGVNR